MIKTRSTYDRVMASLKTQDEIQSVYIPELGHNADVVFVRNQLYIAEGSQQNRIWYSVAPETLAAGPVPILPPRAAHASVHSNLSTPTSNQTPPPPYSAFNYGQSHLNLAPGQLPAAGQIAQSQPLQNFANPSAPTPFTKALPTDIAPRVVGSFAAAGEKVGLQSMQLADINHADRRTGMAVPHPAPGAVPRPTFDVAKVVDPKTGKRVLHGTPGAIRYSTYLHRRPVDPLTGELVAHGTPGAITHSTYQHRKPVHPITGERVPYGTPGAITQHVYNHAKPIDPTTGKRVKPGTPGAIPASAYKRKIMKQKAGIQDVPVKETGPVPSTYRRTWKLAPK